MMTLEDLEEALEEILPHGFEVDTDKNGQIVIYTGLTQDDEGDLVEFEDDDDDDKEEIEDFDFESLEEDDDDDE